MRRQARRREQAARGRGHRKRGATQRGAAFGEGRTTAMLLPFSRMVSSFVTRRPSGVLSLRAGAPRQRRSGGAPQTPLGFVQLRPRLRVSRQR
jgi:hypothetical protein